jgi:hypothetical protein
MSERCPFRARANGTRNVSKKCQIVPESATRSRRAEPSGVSLVSHLRESVVDRVARGETAGRLSQKLPPTAIYCHYGAAKPLRPLRPLHSLLTRRGHAGQPGTRAESRERGPRGASVGYCYRVQFVYSDAPNEAICPKSIGVGTCDRVAPALD